jgi:hypothetical protein
MALSRMIACGVALALASHVALAQTCAAPLRLYSNANVEGDTCAGTNELGTVCIFGSSPANDIVYSIYLAPDYGVTVIVLTNNTPSWNAALLLLQGACNGNTPCPRNADTNGAGGNESLDVQYLATGNYLMLVTSTNGDPSCGSYGLTSNGFMPVELQNFDVN